MMTVLTVFVNPPFTCVAVRDKHVAFKGGMDARQFRVAKLRLAQEFPDIAQEILNASNHR